MVIFSCPVSGHARSLCDDIRGLVTGAHLLWLRGLECCVARGRRRASGMRQRGGCGSPRTVRCTTGASRCPTCRARSRPTTAPPRTTSSSPPPTSMPRHCAGTPTTPRSAPPYRPAPQRNSVVVGAACSCSIARMCALPRVSSLLVCIHARAGDPSYGRPDLQSVSDDPNTLSLHGQLMSLWGTASRHHEV